MQDLDEFTATDAALEQMAATPNPRLKEIGDAAVRHMHAFAREVNLTPEEWLFGIQFLTEVGKACTPVRQEFILLSDVLGAQRGGQRAARQEGARAWLAEQPARAVLSRGRAGIAAGRLHRGATRRRRRSCVYGQVTDNDGTPIPNALIQVWQTSEHGLYDLQTHGLDGIDLRANFRTDAQGRYHFRTVRPLGYSIPMDGPVGEMVQAQNRHGFRPSHIHFLIGGEGYRELVTALYFGDDAHIDSDTVFGVSGSLVVSAEEDPNSPVPGLRAVHYDFRLAAAAPGESGRVGADPSKLMAAE